MSSVAAALASSPQHCRMASRQCRASAASQGRSWGAAPMRCAPLPRAPVEAGKQHSQHSQQHPRPLVAPCRRRAFAPPCAEASRTQHTVSAMPRQLDLQELSETCVALVAEKLEAVHRKFQRALRFLTVKLYVIEMRLLQRFVFPLVDGWRLLQSMAAWLCLTVYESVYLHTAALMAAFVQFPAWKPRSAESPALQLLRCLQNPDKTNEEKLAVLRESIVVNERCQQCMEELMKCSGVTATAIEQLLTVAAARGISQRDMERIAQRLVSSDAHFEVALRRAFAAVFMAQPACQNSFRAQS